LGKLSKPFPPDFASLGPLGNEHNGKQCLTDRKQAAIRARDVRLPGGGKKLKRKGLGRTGASSD